MLPRSRCASPSRSPRSREAPSRRPTRRLRLIRDSTLAGEHGAPAEPFSIRAVLESHPDVLVTDERGAFTIPELPVATWWLGPYDEEGRYEADARRIEVRAGVEELALDLVVRDTRAAASEAAR